MAKHRLFTCLQSTDKIVSVGKRLGLDKFFIVDASHVGLVDPRQDANEEAKAIYREHVEEGQHFGVILGIGKIRVLVF